MGTTSIVFVAATISFAATISIGLGAPGTINPDKIKAAVSQLECVSSVVLPIDQNRGLGDLWLPIYFPIIMHTNTLYECQTQKSQPQSDECVDEEMREFVFTLIGFLENAHENDSDAAQEIHAALVSQCGLVDVPTPDDASIYLPHRENRINIKEWINIEHLKCMVQAIVVAVEDDEDAIDWIIYHIELKESIEILIACNRLSGIDKKVCIISELRTTIKTILDLWKFFAEKKHIKVLGHIKAQVKERCHKKPFQI